MPQAIPFFKAIGGLLVASGVKGFIARLVFSALVSVVTSKLFAPKAPKGAGLSSIQIMTRSALEFRKRVYGQALVSGPIFYSNLTGANGEYLWYAIALCEGEVEDFTAIHFDGDVILKAEIDWTAGAAGADGTGTGNVTNASYLGDGSPAARAVQLFYHLGHADQVVSAALNAAFSDIGANHRARGVAYIIAKLLYNEDTKAIWEKGRPSDIKGLVKGMKVFDRRKYALNADPDFETLVRPLKFGGGVKWFNSSHSTEASLIANADSYSVAAGVLTVSNNDNTANIAVTDKIDVDLTKSYVASVAAKQVSGDRDNSLVIIWYDINGDIIDMTADAATGWLNKTVAGTYFEIDNAVFAGATTVYEIEFGVTGAQFPQGTTAVQMALMIIHADDGTTDTTVELSNAHIREGGIADTQHDLDTASTWEWSDNPAMCIADYLTQVMGVPESRIDWTSFNEAAQFNDVTVPIDTSSPETTEKRFTCNGAVSMGSSHKENLDSLVSSCDGRLTYTTGKWKLRPSSWEASSLTITPDDLAGGVTVRGSSPKEARFNLIRGFIVDPDRNYEAVEFPHVSVASYVTRDNGETIPYDLELPMTNSVTMAQRIAYRNLLQGDNQILANLKMNARGAKVAIGDVVTLDIPELGWHAGGNLLVYSEDFTQADWTKTNSTVTANATPGPFGSNDGSLLANDGTAGATSVFDAVVIASGDTVPCVWYVKAKDFDWAFISVSSGASYGRSYFDLVNRVIGTAEENVFTVLSTDMKSMGDGWSRISVLVKTTGVTSVAIQLRVAEDDLDSSLPSSSGLGIYMFGAQAIVGTDMFPLYHKTSGAAVATTAKDFRVVEWARDPSGAFSLACREDNSVAYDDPAGSFYGIAASGGVTIPTDVVPPPSNLAAAAAPGAIKLTWTNPPYGTYDQIDVYEDTNNSWAGAVKIASLGAGTDNYVIPHDPGYVGYYWVKAIRLPAMESIRDPDSDTTTITATADPLGATVGDIDDITLTDDDQPDDADNIAGVGVRVDSDGDIYTKANENASYASVSTYLGNGTNADLECKVTLIGPGRSSGTTPDTGTMETWLVCSSDRTWEWDRVTVAGNEGGIYALSFRRVSDNAILATIYIDAYIKVGA